MKKLILLMLVTLVALNTSAQEKMTTAEAKLLYQSTSKQRVSIHDPSVVYDESQKCYYIFGSHRGVARSTDLRNWTSTTVPWATASSTNASNAEAFVTPAVKKVKKGGVEVDMPAFNAMDWSKRSDSGYDINGNMWAPDVIWNPSMEKWCYYLSV
ncbi:hypothetical protein LJB84_00790, partial [Bacteroidales bacterium OttesenSCG-928-J19]|nr:hypothetical protein [Bacteroidales bacterium OttesenSCG-928-J19]